MTKTVYAKHPLSPEDRADLLKDGPVLILDEKFKPEEKTKKTKKKSESGGA